jgi:hypothetical protein
VKNSEIKDYFYLIKEAGFQRNNKGLLSRIRIFSEKTEKNSAVPIKNYVNIEKIQAEFKAFDDETGMAIHYLIEEFISNIEAEISAFNKETDIKPFLSQQSLALQRSMEECGCKDILIKKALTATEEVTISRQMGKNYKYFHKPGSHPFADRQAHTLIKIFKLYVEYFPKLSERKIVGSMAVILSRVDFREDISEKDQKNKPKKYFEWIRKKVSKRNLAVDYQFELSADEWG